MFDVPQKFYELCRLCLSLDGVKYSIFTEGGTQQNFAEKISACLSITVRCSAMRDYPYFIGCHHLCYLSRRGRVCVSPSASFLSSLRYRLLFLSLSRPPSSPFLSFLSLSLSQLSALEALSRALYREIQSRSLLAASLSFSLSL